jgi:signal peptidase I
VDTEPTVTESNPEIGATKLEEESPENNITENEEAFPTESEDNKTKNAEEVQEKHGEQTAPRRKSGYDPDHPRRIDGLFDFIELFVFTLATVLLLTTFVFRYSVVDGESMVNTLHEDEKLIISDLFYTPSAGDVIVLEDYTTALKKPLVKRVIATEGQTVRIAKDGVYVDGVKLDESYVYIDEANYQYDVFPKAAIRENPDFVYVRDEFYQITVPENEIFVMGDHRNKSTDSRDIGTIRQDAVLGKVILRVFPFDSFGGVD